MPFGDFKDFSECMTAQKEKGLNDADANRVCGFLQKKAEKKENVNFDGKNYITESGQKYTKDGYRIVAQNVPVIFECNLTYMKESKVGENKEVKDG